MTEQLFFAKHLDNRGSHMKFFTEDTAKSSGFNDVHEIFMTTNNKYTLRGLHRQNEPVVQQKIIKVVNGRFNVRVVFPQGVKIPVDASDSATNIEILEPHNDAVVYYDDLTPNDPPIFVPTGALLGYLALEDNSKMLYIADNDFNVECDDGFNAFDNRFNIDWGISKDKVNISNRDAESPNY